MRILGLRVRAAAPADPPRLVPGEAVGWPSELRVRSYLPGHPAVRIPGLEVQWADDRLDDVPSMAQLSNLEHDPDQLASGRYPLLLVIADTLAEQEELDRGLRPGGWRTIGSAGPYHPEWAIEAFIQDPDGLAAFA